MVPILHMHVFDLHLSSFPIVVMFLGGVEGRLIIRLVENVGNGWCNCLLSHLFMTQ